MLIKAEYCREQEQKYMTHIHKSTRSAYVLMYHAVPLPPTPLLRLPGGMVFTFLKARGQGVGSSLVEEDKLELAKELEVKAKAAGVQIILPSDLVVADAFAADAKTQVVKADSIPDGWMGLDNGPEATTEIQAALKEVCLFLSFSCCSGRWGRGRGCRFL